MDVTMLPVPKEQMKVALKVAWVAESDERRKEALEAAYLVLSYFQEDIGPVPFELGSDPNFLMSKDGRARVELAARLHKAATVETGELAADFRAFKAELVR
jgi:hypothetical protein